MNTTVSVGCFCPELVGRALVRPCSRLACRAEQLLPAAEGLHQQHTTAGALCLPLSSLYAARDVHKYYWLVPSSAETTSKQALHLQH